MTFIGFAAWKFAVALLLIVGALALRRALGAVILKRSAAEPGDRRQLFSNACIEALGPSIGLFPFIVVAILFSQLLAETFWIEDLLVKASRSLIVIAIALALFRAVQPCVWFVGSRAARLSRLMACRVAWICELLIGLLAILAMLNIWRSHIQEIIAVLALFVVAMGCGASAHARDVMEGLRIFARQRFRSGDWIRASGVVEGTVVAVSLRTTVVRRVDTGLANVPNSKLGKVSVTRSAHMSHSCVTWMLEFSEQTTRDQLSGVCRRIRDYILNSDEFRHPPHAPVLVHTNWDESAATSVLVQCFTRSKEVADSLAAKETLVRAIEQIVEVAGVELVRPRRAAYVEGLPAGTMLFPRHEVEI